MEEAKGLKFKIGKWRFRIWKTGLEWGDRLGGRVYLFPWNPAKKNIKN